MNKEKIVQELDTYVKTIDSCFSVNDGDGDLTLNINGSYIAYFLNFNVNKYIIDTTGNDYGGIIDVINFDIIKKFYDKAVDLLNEYEQQYSVQVIDNEFGYLNINMIKHQYLISDNIVRGAYKTTFTQSEIEALKQRDDIAIDWDKAIIKEAN